MVDSGVSDLRRILELAQLRAGDSVAVEHDAGSITYNELVSDSSAIALGLLENCLPMDQS